MYLLGTRVAVQADPNKENVTESGLVIVSEGEGSTITGTVLYSGAEVKNKKLKTGLNKPRILFDKYFGLLVKKDGKEFYIVKEEDIIAVL